MTPNLSRARAASGALLLASLAACSEGAGRPPVFPDAELLFDAAPVDFGPRIDAGLDAGFAPSDVELVDSGPPAAFPFSGVYSYLGGADRLLAREVRGRVSIIVGQPPFVYVGTIDGPGNVNLRSPLLERSGCDMATITGYYERPAAALFLRHQSCSVAGTAIDAQMRGGFDADFARPWSGVYLVEARVDPARDLRRCYQGMATVQGLLWGVSVIGATNTVIVHTAHDLIGSQTVYVGTAEAAGRTFAAVEDQVYGLPQLRVSIQGQFIQNSVNDAPVIVGQRDVFDPVRNCTFPMQFVGTLIAGP